MASLIRELEMQVQVDNKMVGCIAVARLEMAASLPALFEAFPKLELAGNPVMRPTFVLRGYESIAVTA